MPSTVQEDDVVAADRLAPPSYGLEMAFLKHNRKQKWFWMSNQSPEDVVEFIVFDSHPKDGRFNRASTHPQAEQLLILCQMFHTPPFTWTS